MANNVNATTTMADSVKTEYNSNLLMRALPRLVHGRWAQKAVLSKHGSYEWRRYGSLAVATTPLTEATTPTEETAPSLTLVTSTPLWYGAFLKITDRIELVSIDPIVMAMSAILGEQAGKSIDTIRRNVITTGATKLYSGDQASRGAINSPSHNISYHDVLMAIAQLAANDATPVNGDRYILILHTDSMASLMEDPTFVNAFTAAAARTDNNPIMSGYQGYILGCDIYCTTNAREYPNEGAGGTVDVYSALFIGKEAYGSTGIGAFAPKEVDNAGPDSRTMTGRGSPSPVNLIVHPVGDSGAADPLDLVGSVAWKASEDTDILNSAFIVDLEHANLRSNS